MKRKITSAVLILCMITGLCGCGKSPADSRGDTDTDTGYIIGNEAKESDTQNKSETNAETGAENSGAEKPEQETGGDEENGQNANESEAADDKDGYVIDTKSGTDYFNEYRYDVSNENGFIPAWVMSDDTDQSHEEYAEIDENVFRSTLEYPLSSFAADADTASYANVRRLLNASDLKTAGKAARIEEMINYFSYDYPEPKDGEPFSVTTEIFKCPWNSETDILKIGLKAANPHIEKPAPSNLVFLIDVSGSMSTSDKLPLIKQAFLILTENLNDGDKISIVTYASQTNVLLDGATSKQVRLMQTAIGNLKAGGGTNGSDGLTMAYNVAKKNFIEGGNNRIIVATDGDLNAGITGENELRNFISKKRQSGIFLSIMGFGSGNVQDSKLEILADCGNGNYSFIDSIGEARRVLIEEKNATLFTVAKDVKFQTEFNPAKIKGYRLIGYENRAIKNEDFANDARDGGEVGAGHTLTVLYEIATTDSKQEIPSNGLKYQSKPNSKSDEFLTLSVRFKQPNGEKSELLTYPVDKRSVTETPSEDSIFAAAVAQFGMLLKNSEHTQNTSYGDIINRISGLACIKNNEYKSEFLTLVKKAELLKASGR